MTDFIDACSAIDAWQQYPLKKHAKLWAWIAQEASSQRLQTVSVVAEEIEFKEAVCREWLHKKGLVVVAEKNIGVEIAAANIAGRLGVQLGKKRGRSSGSISDADIALIAAALHFGGRVITEEKRQVESSQRKLMNYKIPNVCDLFGVEVLSFNQYTAEKKR